jgi:glucosamine 6-phosphate synthetase-like amidotransferase/phosphosugar isomerase protein
VNSRHYLNYSRISLGKTGYSFSTKEDAEIVAGMIVKMIQNGNMSPKLNKRIIDSLELKMNVR